MRRIALIFALFLSACGTKIKHAPWIEYCDCPDAGPCSELPIIDIDAGQLDAGQLDGGTFDTE